MYYWIYFNPRSREGSDFGKIMKYLSEVDFNPRSREGSDYNGGDKCIIGYISIHAPARGATSVKS